MLLFYDKRKSTCSHPIRSSWSCSGPFVCFQRCFSWLLLCFKWLLVWIVIRFNNQVRCHLGQSYPQCVTLCNEDGGFKCNKLVTFDTHKLNAKGWGFHPSFILEIYITYLYDPL